MQLQPLPAFSDNYIWLLSDGGTAWAVDPGDAGPVLRALATHKLLLEGILLTHHHGDHSGGIESLRKHFPALCVYGPANSPAKGMLTHPLQAGDGIRIGSAHFEILEIPGHTLDHIAFYNKAEKLLFCGDTLFSGGCGRVFEGSYEQMFASLQQLAALPDDTQVYCAHEYTLSNLRFGLQAEPDNQDIALWLDHCEQLRERQQPTLPSTIAREKEINVFLRAANSERFSALREWKNCC